MCTHLFATIKNIHTKKVRKKNRENELALGLHNYY
jgi:hypothetical protein